jgi:hypothetical protein
VSKFKEYLARHGDSPRASRTTKPTTARSMRADVGDVSTVRSHGFDAASVALPAGIDLDDRAAKMNAFWRALAEFQHCDVLVVALCIGEER